MAVLQPGDAWFMCFVQGAGGADGTPDQYVDRHTRSFSSDKIFQDFQALHTRVGQSTPRQQQQQEQQIAATATTSNSNSSWPQDAWVRGVWVGGLAHAFQICCCCQDPSPSAVNLPGIQQ
jgi:hypothetical protein